MKYTTSLLLSAALALTVVPGLQSITRVNAQDLPSGIPACAEPALRAAIEGSGCTPTDAQCICSDPTVIPSLASAVSQGCSPADQAAIEVFGQTYCGTGPHITSGTITPAPKTAYPTVGLPPRPTSTTSGGVQTEILPIGTTTSISKPPGFVPVPTVSPTNGTRTGGAAVGAEAAMGAAALAVAIGAMGWVFSEL